MAGEITIEKLAEMTAQEFGAVHREIDGVRGVVRELNEKMDTGFTALRQEMHEGFRAVLAAVETVEYTKLRMRLDAVEERLERVEAAANR